MDFRNTVYKKTLLLMLGVTALFYRLNANLPTRWYSLIETLQVSTGIVHTRLSVIDREVEKEYKQLEKDFERQLGIETFYNPKEIKEIKEEVEKELKLKS